MFYKKELIAKKILELEHEVKELKAYQEKLNWQENKSFIYLDETCEVDYNTHPSVHCVRGTVLSVYWPTCVNSNWSVSVETDQKTYHAKSGSLKRAVNIAVGNMKSDFKTLKKIFEGLDV